MAVSNRHVEWSQAERDRNADLAALGVSALKSAAIQNREFHKRRPVRTEASIANFRRKYGIKVARVPKQEVEVVAGVEVEQRVERTETKDGLTFTAIGQRIKTLEDLALYAELDMTRWEWYDVTTNVWDTTVVDRRTSRAKKVQNYQIKARAKQKAGPSTLEAVEALIAGAFATRKPLARQSKQVRDKTDPNLLQVVVIADPHIGKLAWPEGTGGTAYDTDIATAVLRQCAGELIARGSERGVQKRHLYVLGDALHHDGKGATTKGTPLDYDSRVQKMLREGAQAFFDIVEASADTARTTVCFVPGNHDYVLTWALQRIMVSEFRHHRNVTIDDRSTTTKYFRHGKVLLGLDHGDKGKKRLHEAMAHDCATEWGQTTYREIHTGHLHGSAKIETLGGVVIRTAPSLSPPDQWHVDEKFGAGVRAMEAFVYHAGGALVAMDVATPDLNAQPKAGTR